MLLLQSKRSAEKQFGFGILSKPQHLSTDTKTNHRYASVSADKESVRGAFLENVGIGKQKKTLTFFFFCDYPP